MYSLLRCDHIQQNDSPILNISDKTYTTQNLYNDRDFDLSILTTPLRNRINVLLIVFFRNVDVR